MKLLLLGVRRGRAAVVVAACLAGMTARSAAHDFWIDPSAFHPRPGSLVGLRLLVGQDMIGDPVPREPASIERFVVAQGAGQKPVPGRDGGDPAGILKVDGPGLLVVGYQSLPRAIELPPGKFEQYLGEEGLDEIRHVIADPSKQRTIARELFVRCAKTLLASGDTSASQSDSRLGLTLELMAERNPYASKAGERLPFVLTYEGKVKPGALVIAVSARNPSQRLSARTDKAGRVTFVFPHGGTWLVKAVHMTAAPAASGADWHSFWASTSFDLPESHGRS